VYVFVENTSALYVHHDNLLAAYPLALQYLPFNPINPENHGNSVAIGSFMQGIEIWDLDILDAVEPVVNLGGILGKKVR
jgi:periodic tryptophan protein 1